MLYMVWEYLVNAEIYIFFLFATFTNTLNSIAICGPYPDATPYHICCRCIALDRSSQQEWEISRRRWVLFQQPSEVEVEEHTIHLNMGAFLTNLLKWRYNFRVKTIALYFNKCWSLILKCVFYFFFFYLIRNFPLELRLKVKPK